MSCGKAADGPRNVLLVELVFREWTKAPGSESAARICPRKSPSKRGLRESYFLQGIIGKTHTQNLQILREDTLAATCSAGPFCLLPSFRDEHPFFSGEHPLVEPEPAFGWALTGWVLGRCPKSRCATELGGVVWRRIPCPSWAKYRDFHRGYRMSPISLLNYILGAEKNT